MKLWLLKPIDDEAGPWEPWFDKCFGMVVRAEDEISARSIANLNAGDEQAFDDEAGPWLDAVLTSCVELTPEGDAGLIIQDVHWA